MSEEQIPPSEIKPALPLSPVPEGRFKAKMVARGDLLVSLSLILAAICFYGLQSMKPTYRVKILRKPVVIKAQKARPILNYAPYGFLLFAGYRILRRRTTIIEANRTNLSYASGILSRNTDALSITGIQDFQKHRSLFDAILGTASIVIHSNDKTHPVLKISHLSAKAASDLYEHLSLYTNSSYTEFMQAQMDAKERQLRRMSGV